VVFGYLVGERPEVLIWAGVVLALPAILLLSIERGDGRGEALKSLRMGLIAGLGFGGFFILLSQTSRDSGLWPLLAARTASVPALLLITMLRRKPLVLSKGSRAAGPWSGCHGYGSQCVLFTGRKIGNADRRRGGDIPLSGPHGPAPKNRLQGKKSVPPDSSD
jgi:drug/metabolite transporter (DMT)-like permease